MIRDVEGVIPYGVGVALIVASAAVLAMAILVFIVFAQAEKRLHAPRSEGRICGPSDIPSPAEVDAFLKSLTPEDFTAAEKFAADFRRANGRSDA